MKLWKKFWSWHKRMFFSTNFDLGYDWAQRELRWGRTPEDILVQCDADSGLKTAFDRGAEKAARDHLAKEPK